MARVTPPSNPYKGCESKVTEDMTLKDIFMLRGESEEEAEKSANLEVFRNGGFAEGTTQEEIDEFLVRLEEFRTGKREYLFDELDPANKNR